MQTILKALVVVIFVFSILTFGTALMVAYSQRDLAKQVGDVRGKVSKATKDLDDATEARPNAKEADQGWKYWKAESEKFENANKRDEEKKYPQLMEGLTTKYAQERTAFDKVEEENIKASERTLTEKQRALKDLTTKVQQARVEHAKAKADGDALEAQKKELLNRTAQATILLDDVRKRHQEVGEQLDAAKKTAQPGT